MMLLLPIKTSYDLTHLYQQNVDNTESHALLMNAKAYAEMSVATVLYGLTFPLTTMALEAMGPLYLSFIRSLWSFVFFIIYFLIRGYPRGQNYALLFGISVFGLVLSIIFQNVGMLYTAASMASIIQSTAPIFVIFLAFFLIREKLTFSKMLGASIGIIGTIIVMFNGASGGNSTMFGNIMMLCSAASLALLAILEKLALSKHSPIDIIGITSILGFPMLLLIALPLEQPPAFTLSSVILTIVISIGCTVLPYFLWLEGLRELEVSRAIVFSYGITAFGIIFSVLLLNESVSLSMITGMAVIFFHMDCPEVICIATGCA